MGQSWVGRGLEGHSEAWVRVSFKAELGEEGVGYSRGCREEVGGAEPAGEGQSRVRGRRVLGGTAVGGGLLGQVGVGSGKKQTWGGLRGQQPLRGLGVQRRWNLPFPS